MSFSGSLVLVVLQALLIIGLSRVLGYGARVLRQPMVIAEIVAGIALGPSLLGFLFPDMQHALAALIQTPRPLEYLRLTGRSKPERSFSLSARNCSLRCRRGLRQRPVSAS